MCEPVPTAGKTLTRPTQRERTSISDSVLTNRQGPPPRISPLNHRARGAVGFRKNDARHRAGAGVSEKCR